MKRGNRKRKIGRWVILAALLGVVAFLFAGHDGVVTLYRTHRELTRARSEISRLHAATDSLKMEIAKLQTDTAYIEKIARERLGMARKDETMYRFVDRKDRGK